MYMVTGGAGFIGSNMVAALEEKGAGQVAVCDRLRSGAKWRNIAKRELVDVVHPDRLFEFLEDNRSRLDAIVHMGAVSATTETDADLIIETNFRLSVALWTWCATNHVPLVYASSAATYGNGSQGFDDDAEREALARLRPLNAYGWSKLLFDRWVARVIADDGPVPLQWAGLRFFNVYGPNEYHKGTMKSVAAHVFPAARENQQATLFKSHHPDYEDGGQLRDFVWIGDCVDIMMWLLDNEGVSGLFNCGTGMARSFADLTGAVYRALGREPEIAYVPTPVEIRDKYQYFTQADMGRLRAAGYEKAPTSLEEGITAYVRQFLDTTDPYR